MLNPLFFFLCDVNANRLTGGQREGRYEAQCACAASLRNSPAPCALRPGAASSADLRVTPAPCIIHEAWPRGSPLSVCRGTLRLFKRRFKRSNQSCCCRYRFCCCRYPNWPAFKSRGVFRRFRTLSRPEAPFSETGFCLSCKQARN